MNIKPKATFIGKHLLEYETLESTNTFTQDLVSKSNPSEGTVVFTHYQTAGKGQYGRKWESNEGQNITLSIVLTPSFLQIRDQFYLNIITSLAVANTIEHYIKDQTKIKWPNDVYVGDKKICGILIQNNLSGNKIVNSIIGIGINVNQDRFHPDLPNPMSIKLLTGCDQNLVEIRETLFGELEKVYMQLKAEKQDEIMQEYQERLYRLGVPTNFQIEDRKVEGIIKSINPSGQLVIDINGQLESFSKTEIQYLK